MDNSQIRVRAQIEGYKFQRQESKQKVAESKERRAETNLKKEQVKLQRQKHKHLVQQGKKGNVVERISKAVGYNKSVSNKLLNDFSGYANQSSQSSGKRAVGRPEGYRTHISPFSGQPIYATQYYKEMRLFRRQQTVMAQHADQAKQVQYARQGVPPQQISQVEMQRQMMQRQMQTQNMQMPQQQRQPMQQVPVQQVQPQHVQQFQRPTPQVGQVVTDNSRPSIWNRQGFLDKDWTLFGTKTVVRGIPQSFFN